MNPRAASAARRSSSGMGAIVRPGPRDVVTADSVAMIGEAWESAAMKVIVDRDLCEANGVCVSLVPAVFDLDDEDVLHIMVDDVPAEQADLVRRAVQSCPKIALRLED